MALPALGLVVFSWGNASGLDRERGLFAIKPSGVDYDELTPESLVVCDLDGKVVEGDLRPSSDMQRMLPSTAPGATVLAAWCTRTPTPPSPRRRRGFRSRATGPRRPTIFTARWPACGGSPRRRSRRPTSSTLAM